jgi:YD repeat-containing protein
MPINPAARQGDPIGHASVLGGMLKFGTGLVGTVIKTVATCKLLKIGTKAIKVFSAMTALTGPGILAGVAGLAVSAVVEWGIEKAAEHVDEAKAAADAFIDSACPGSITGALASGSSNVIINGQPAALTVVSVAPCSLTGHPPSIAAEGSSGVLINDQLAHRKGDDLTCGAKTVQGSPDVIVGGGTGAVLPIKRDLVDILSDMDSALRKGFEIFDQVRSYALLGKGLLTCGLKKFITCPSMILGLGGLIFNVASSHPVNMLSGHKILLGPEEEDFTLPARLPIEWHRHYISDKTRGGIGPLGVGWSLPFSIRLHVNQPGEHPIVLHVQGHELLFPAVAPGERQYNPYGGWEVARLPSGQYVAHDDALLHIFSPAAGEGPQTLRLERIEDENGNWTSLRYYENGLLRQLVSSSGTLLDCVPHERHADRIGSVSLKGDVLVRYDYDPAGNLSEVINRAGEVARSFRYTYLPSKRFAGHPLMDWHRMPSGLEAWYTWAEYADHPRVVACRTNIGQSWKADYDIAAGVTTYEDHLGRRQRWTWHTRYGMLSHTDALNRTAVVERNEFGLPVRCENYNGGIWQFEYDDEGNEVQRIDPLGNVTGTDWNAKYRKPGRETLPDGSAWEYGYDGRGNLASVTDPGGGRAELCRNAHDQVQVYLDAKENVFRYGWNERGLLEHFTDCSGNVTRYGYDGFGNLVGTVDALGQKETAVYDALHRLTALHLPDGSSRAYAWNRSNLLIESKDGLEQATSWAYDREGRPTRQKR